MRQEIDLEQLVGVYQPFDGGAQAEVQVQQKEAKKQSQARSIEAGMLKTTGLEGLWGLWTQGGEHGLATLQNNPKYNARIAVTPDDKQKANDACAAEFARRKCGLLLPSAKHDSAEYKELYPLLHKWAMNKLDPKGNPELTPQERKDLETQVRKALGVMQEPIKPKPHEIAKPVTLNQDAVNNIPDSLGTPDQVQKLRKLWQERQSNRISGMELQALLAARADKKPLMDEELKLVRTHLLGSTLARIRNPVEKSTFISTLKGTEYEALLKEANTLDQEQRSKAENLIHAGEARRINSLRKGGK